MGRRVTQLSTIAVIGCCILLIHPVQSIKLPVRRNTTFTWTTGRWGVCYSYDKCGKGEKERHVSCSDSEGFRTLETNCDINTKPPTVTTCFRVCDEHRNQLRWRVGEWGPCLSVEVSETSNVCRETTGRAVRTVTCIYTSPEGISEKVEGAACARFDKKPDDTLPCSKDCPQDCIVTDFQPWTSCNGCEAVNRTKSRIVLVAPNKEGRTCPPLSIMEPCSNMAACLQRPLQKPRYLLKIGRWSPCISSPHLKPDSIKTNYQHRPEIGQRVRNITCLTDLGDIVDLSFCQHNYKTIETVQNCIVRVNCVLSPWSEWSIQEEGCITSEGRIVPEIRTRSRRLLKLPEGDGFPCSPLYDERIITSGLPPCDKYIWVASEWSDCVVIYQQKIFKPLCGGGLQLRNLTCLRSSDHVPVSTLFCKESKPATIQRCHIPCPQDCEVSQWTQWSPCIPYNKTDFFQISGEGYKLRSRKILVEPTSNGKECPHLHEVDLCEKSQLVMWKYGEWGSCRLHSQQTCGEGIQTRERQCIKVNGSSAVEAMCILHLLPPHDTATCYVPCPEDCVISEWSPWSKCSVSCSDNHAGGEYFQNRTILAHAGIGGKRCPQFLSNTDICNQDSCKGFKWKTLPWNECRITGNATCGEGIQVRKVLCIYDKEDIYVAIKKCSGISKPAVKRACTIPCPIDCSVTKFSEWSTCSDDCETDLFQYRQRYILELPKFGGKLCSTVMKEERSCLKKNGIQCRKKSLSSKTYKWDIGQWSSCILPQVKNCGKGFQIRNVTCIHEDNRGVEPDMCINSNFFLDDQIPSRSRRCFVSCDKNCAVSEWSEWSLCENACISKTNRTRQLLTDDYDTIENCKNQFPTVEEKSCPYPMDLSSVSSHWQECIVDENDSNITVNGRSIIGKCGTGQKFRQTDGFDMKNCHQMGYEVDMCVVECPRDCKVTAWSSWSVNNASCGSVYRHRHRKVIHTANKFGRPCINIQNGIENETKVENVSCVAYSWLAGNWMQCTTSGICGNGTQKREINCVRTIDETNPIKVDINNCNSVPKPPVSRECYLPCPKDCVVSEWSEWSECDKTCNNLYNRTRKRIILRYNSESGKPCPSLVDSENCLLGTNCFYYIWKVGNWSSCVLPEGAFCGEGKQRRAIQCVRNDGHFTSISKCFKNAQLPDNIEKSCYIDCPIDCEVSEWSEWDKRDCQQCGLKKQMIRSRHVIQPPSERGQPCLQPLIQHKPCPFNPCYYWSSSNWSDCILKGADCGYGIRTRTVQCKRQDDVTVSNRYCFLVNWTSPLTKKVDLNWLALSFDHKETEECYIPCPGDCQMSDWSLWSHCHRDCSSAEIVGYQTRSRIIQLFPSNHKSEQCSDTFWESRPCWGGPCYSFSWKMIGNDLKCLRSDGLTVIGGCRHVAKPCHPPCKEPGTICNTTLGVCQCGNNINNNKKTKCVIMNPNETNSEEILLKYFPDDSQKSIWMYAMITVGIAFVIFVFITMYLMCHSSLRQRLMDIRRQAGVRRRVHNPPEIEKRCTYDG
ncbi:thrombospondin type-1 domain-containing protein 7A-like isoform X2 [Centruroides vittatus]